MLSRRVATRLFVALLLMGMAGAWFTVRAMTIEEVERLDDEVTIFSESFIDAHGVYTKDELDHWQRPDGPLRVGIQAGHWKNDEVPEDLAELSQSGAGAVGGGTTERELMLSIAKRVAALLEEKGIAVDILPATVPPGYVADAFISIHADGNPDPSVSGFKIASSRKPYSGNSTKLEAALYDTYEEATGLSRDPNITRRMHGYYAFNWRRHYYAVHPHTPSVIIETGFLTSYQDQQVLIYKQDRVAQGIADGIRTFLAEGGGE